MSSLPLIRRHRYEIISFLTGASVMMLEIVGARLIAPYFGTSTYVWTAMIGVILGALSFGFWYGGRLADRYDSKQDLGIIIAMAAALVLFMSFLHEPVLESLANQKLDLRLSAVIAAFVLFGPASLLIGMVSPHLAKIRVTSLKTTGATIGRLEAAGSVGSIAGTFLSGYWLLAYFGARNLTFMLVILLIITSFLANRHRLLWPRIALVVMAGVAIFTPSSPKGVIDDRDSAYSRYQVRSGIYEGRPANFLLMDSYSIQSASFLDEPSTPVFAYTKAMLGLATYGDAPDKVLVIGGGAHTLPTALHTALPGTTIDVAEIDPALDNIAREYFGFSDSEHIHIYYEDGRSFINSRSDQYDFIFMDAFSSLTPPFHLTSREAVERVAYNLGPDGIAVVNVPGKYEGDFLASVAKTYDAVFGRIEVFQANPTIPLSQKQNFIILAAKTNDALGLRSAALGEPLPSLSGGMILTDDYAPVERLSY